MFKILQIDINIFNGIILIRDLGMVYIGAGDEEIARVHFIFAGIGQQRSLPAEDEMQLIAVLRMAVHGYGFR